MPSSFEGNEGNEGNSGFMGSGGGAGRGFIPDRVSLPFVTIDFSPGNPVSDQRINVRAFPERNWAPEWYSYLVLAEFVSDTVWDNFDLLPPWAPGGAWPPATDPNVRDELDNLVTAAQDDRPDALAEILAQADEFGSYFLALLTASNGYPATTKILNIASFVAGFCAMFYKGLYARPRPSMLCPALLPAVLVPGHASFPSGHSTQAHLMALCMGDVLTGLPQMPAMQNDLTALADRIARNREIAGVHYPSDSAAGVMLATDINPLLQSLLTPRSDGTPNPSWYRKAMTAAQQEWQ